MVFWCNILTTFWLNITLFCKLIIVIMQMSMNVQQTTERVALKLSALIAWAVVSVRVNQDTLEMDKVALVPVISSILLCLYYLSFV